MKFVFDDHLDYQQTAIDSVISIFDTGQNSNKNNSVLKNASNTYYSNIFEIDEERILSKVQEIQKRNKISDISQDLGSLDFSIEMETGTGKTYVYLRTILELHEQFGLTKFIILVPSVAIREGVMKTIKQTMQHFSNIYGQGIRASEYDSSRLSDVKEFINSPLLQVLVMTVQSFNSDQKIMRQTPDQFNGEQPLAEIAKTRPVIIMDEPQNMSSELAKAAIADLNPLFKLRYSATHKEKHNLLYRLTPDEAYARKLVKKIAVFGVDQDVFFEVTEIRKEPIRVRVKLEVKNGDEYETREILLASGDDIAEETGNSKYENLHITEIHPGKGFVELSDNKKYYLNESIDENKKDSIFRLQIRETIKAHIEKQETLGDKAKVLSLFFIDKVDNYQNEGLIKQIFDEEYEKLRNGSKHFKKLDAELVQGAYFAKKNKTGDDLKDTTGSSKSDKEVYDLIMKDKEKLLSFSEPICFIFSHSALKEGWDNPNVFQICTLNETKSAMKKRQEIGRGLRLPVDVDGNRIFDEKTNVLTVVANESYMDYVANMQKEYKDAGYASAPKPTNARKKVKVKFKYDKNNLPEDFKALWDKIKHKTKYNINFSDDELLELIMPAVDEIKPDNMVVLMKKADLVFENNSVKAVYNSTSIGEKVVNNVPIGNIIERIADETELTKTTVLEVLKRTKSLKYIKRNPEEYIRAVITIINAKKLELILNKGLEYTETGEEWKLDIFNDIEVANSSTLEVENSAFSHVIFDSDGESEYAKNLDSSARVKNFVKLPSKFKVPTPLGAYNPDWGIVATTDEKEDRLLLIRETKFGKENDSPQNVLNNLRNDEKEKIAAAKKHFSLLNVDYKASTKTDLTDTF